MGFWSRSLEHPEQVARVVRGGDHVELFEEWGAFDRFREITQGAEFFDGKAHTVEQGDLLVIRASAGLTLDDLPKLGHGMVVLQLLDFTLHPGLRRIFHKN